MKSGARDRSRNRLQNLEVHHRGHERGRYERMQHWYMYVAVGAIFVILAAVVIGLWIKGLADTTDRQVVELKELRGTKESMESELKMLRDGLKKSKNELNELRNELKKSKKELQEFKERNLIQERDLDNVKERNEESQNSLKECHMQLGRQYQEYTQEMKKTYESCLKSFTDHCGSNEAQLELEKLKGKMEEQEKRAVANLKKYEDLEKYVNVNVTEIRIGFAKCEENRKFCYENWRSCQEELKKKWF